MKMVQEDTFSPIAIVLETREEAERFWAIMEKADKLSLTKKEHKMTIDISNMFSMEAHF